MRDIFIHLGGVTYRRTFDSHQNVTPIWTCYYSIHEADAQTNYLNAKLITNFGLLQYEVSWLSLLRKYQQKKISDTLFYNDEGF